MFLYLISRVGLMAATAVVFSVGMSCGAEAGGASDWGMAGSPNTTMSAGSYECIFTHDMATVQYAQLLTVMDLIGARICAGVEYQCASISTTSSLGFFIVK